MKTGYDKQHYNDKKAYKTVSEKSLKKLIIKMLKNFMDVLTQAYSHLEHVQKVESTNALSNIGIKIK